MVSKIYISPKPTLGYRLYPIKGIGVAIIYLSVKSTLHIADIEYLEPRKGATTHFCKNITD